MVHAVSAMKWRSQSPPCGLFPSARDKIFHVWARAAARLDTGYRSSARRVRDDWA